MDSSRLVGYKLRQENLLSETKIGPYDVITGTVHARHPESYIKGNGVKTTVIRSVQVGYTGGDDQRG